MYWSGPDDLSITTTRAARAEDVSVVVVAALAMGLENADSVESGADFLGLDDCDHRRDLMEIYCGP